MKNTEINYTPAMVQEIKEAAPLNLEKAKALGEKLGRSYRSVIAKAKSVGVEYVAQPTPEPKRKGPTKAEVVASIANKLGIDLAGLDKAPVATLNRLAAKVDEII